MGKKTRKSDSAQLDELRELVAESDGDGNGVPAKKTDRRAMLRLAGAAVLGAAGAAALKAVPASAASGNFMVVGCANSATTSTGLSVGGALAGLDITGTTNQYGIISGGNSGSAEIGVWGASKTGNGTGVLGSATSGTGVSGSVTSGTGLVGFATSGTGVSGSGATGVRGTAGAGGIAVNGAGSTGYGGLFTSTTGYDAALGYAALGASVGSGRLGMIGREDVGANAPNIAPTFFVTSTGHFTFEHELVRGRDSSIWASRFASAGANASRWKRINAVRVDSSDGTGNPYKPFRVIDTRSGAKRAAGSMNLVTVAGTGTLTSSIPSSAVAVIGNLTAVAYAGPGFLAIMPGGIVKGTGAGQYNPAVDPSSVNFITGQGAIANSFVCGLHSGQVQVYVGNSASHFIIDVTGYME